MGIPYTIERIRVIVTEAAARHGVGKVYLYGSYACGTDKAESELNLRIERGAIDDLIALGAFQNELERALGLRVDVHTTESFDSAFLRGIAAEEILLYEPAEC